MLVMVNTLTMFVINIHSNIPKEPDSQSDEAVTEVPQPQQNMPLQW